MPKSKETKRIDAATRDKRGSLVRVAQLLSDYKRQVRLGYISYHKDDHRRLVKALREYRNWIEVNLTVPERHALFKNWSLPEGYEWLAR